MLQNQETALLFQRKSAMICCLTNQLFWLIDNFGRNEKLTGQCKWGKVAVCRKEIGSRGILLLSSVSFSTEVSKGLHCIF